MPRQPKPAKIRRHKMVFVFESSHDARSFKAAFKESWFKYDTAFPGTMVFMSHEIVESTDGR